MYSRRLLPVALSLLLILPVTIAAKSAKVSKIEVASMMLYVSPSGSDSNPGTKDRPFKSLARARDAVRNTKWKQQSGIVKDVIVELRGGRYFLTEPVTFDENDSSNYGYKVIYRNYPDEQPVLVAGERVTDWSPYKGKIYRAHVPRLQGLYGIVPQLFENGTVGTVARTPNEGWFRLRSPERQSFCYENGDFDPSGWDISQLQVHMVEMGAFFSHYIPVDRIDRISRRLHLKFRPFYHPLEGKTYFVQNALEPLDSPGEFYADLQTGYLYYWPRTEEISQATIEVTYLPSILRFEAYSLRYPVHDIVLEGLRFEGGCMPEYRTRAWPDQGDNGHPGIEADRQMALTSEHWGQIYFGNASNVTVKDCRIMNAGQNGVSIVGASTRITVTGCEIANSGESGVYIKGDMAAYTQNDPIGPLDINHLNTIHNNYIHNYGRLTITGIGIRLSCNSGSNVISNNLITDGPQSGISLFSQWDIPVDMCAMKGNIIKNNELARCANSCWDGGQFYIGGTTDNTMFVNNRITDSWSWLEETWPQPGARPDDLVPIDFDPGMTYRTYIRDNMSYGANANVVEFGRLTDETLLDNNYFESTDRPGEVLLNGNWTRLDGFDSSRVNREIGLTSEYKQGYPNEITRPFDLPVRWGFEGTLSPMYVYKYSGGSLHEYLSSGKAHGGRTAMVIDKDVLVLRCMSSFPTCSRVSLWMYDDPSKKDAMCMAALRGTKGEAVGVGVNGPASGGHYVLDIQGKTTVTPIARTQGWHEIIFIFPSGGEGGRVMLDGRQVGSTAMKGFRYLEIGDGGFGSDSRGLGFDDVSIE